MTSDNKRPKHIIVNGSVAKQITAIISQNIINGEYPIDSYLPTEEELCIEFGVGRSSVREAIKTLESRGLVRKLQGKGVVVIDESIKATSDMLSITLAYKKTTLKDLMDFRVLMEMQNVEDAANNATEEDIAVLEECLNLMKKDDVSNADDFATHDYLFHEAIAKASRNSVSLIMIKALRRHLYKQIVYTINPNFNSENANHLHEDIFNAIKNKDSQLAIQSMREHLVETQQIIAELDKEKETI